LSKIFFRLIIFIVGAQRAVPSGHRRARQAVLQNEITFEPLAKFTFAPNCHSERSEESSILKVLRSFTSFRMTKKRVLQDPQMTPLYSRFQVQPGNKKKMAPSKT
jgi:hypothetical protein